MLTSSGAQARVINPAGTAPPAGPYNRGFAVGDLLFVAGQVPADSTGKPISGSFEDRIHAVFDNIAGIAAAAGTDLAHVAKLGCYLAADKYPDRFAAWNKVCGERLGAPYPARTTVPCDLPGGFDIEVDAVLWIPADGATDHDEETR